MSVKWVLVIASIIAIVPNIKSIDINCQYIGYDWNDWGPKQTCYATLTGEIKKDNTNVEQIIGDSSICECRIKAVKIEHEHCSYLPTGLMDHFPRMTDLYIFSAHLTHINRYDFKYYKALTTMSLSRNDLSYIPYDTFDDMINLENFSLSFNKLRNIPNLKMLTKLKLLYLFENQIEKLTLDNLSGNPNLKVLWIYNNNLSEIDANIFNFLINLKDARFKGNNCIDMNYPPTSVERIMHKINSNCNENDTTECGELC